MSDLWWVQTKGTSREPKSKITVAEVKRRVSMERLLRHYGFDVENPEDYDWIAVRCPFHGDSNPSASLNRRLNRFRCHVCDIGGDVLDVVMAQEGLTTREAMKWILKTF